MSGLFVLSLFLLAVVAAQGFNPATLSPQRKQEVPSKKAPSKDEIVQDLLAYSRKVGPVGSLASEHQRKEVEARVEKLRKLSGDPRPASTPLRGTHNLVYSAAPGGSSGRLFGPLYGKVTQEFLDDNKTFINSVRFGPLEISLQADKIVKDNKTNVVKFRKSRVKVFGNTILENDISGGGTWKYLFMGEVQDRNGRPLLLRVMETPSLFVIEQPLAK